MKEHDRQDVSLIAPQVINHFTKSPNSSISATFRYYRKNPCYSLIGDFPIFATIINALKQIDIPLNRYKVLYALNQSDEMKEWSKKEKFELLDELLKPLSVQRKQGFIGHGRS
ncbi:MAG: hypothetical protein NTZ55_05325 [Candidatus Roizmanbacteria bacterium]|nr:hypothetical protein [Candidatus Roizmanbacteria bacterium]